MNEILRCALLFDFYGELLTEHQKEIYEEYVLDDLSLSEVAQAHNISRQGVHDLIKRCDRTLEEYENKLHLVERFVNAKQKVEIICQMTMTGESVSEKSLRTINKLAYEILDEL